MKKNLKLIVFTVVLCAVSALNVKVVLDTEHSGDLAMTSLAAIGEGNSGESKPGEGNSGEGGSGEGGSGGALALAVADKVWMLENTIYSILSPEGFATILWKDGSRSEEAAELMKITSGELLNMGIVDKVIPERGYFTSEIIEAIKTAIVDELAELSQLSTEDLLEARYQRFRKY